MYHMAAGAGRALGNCVYVPRKKFTCVMMLLFSVIALIVLSAVPSQLPREDKMEQRIANLQSHLHYLESLYRSRLEDVINIQDKVLAKNENESHGHMVAVDGRSTTTMTPEIQALLKNISGTRAATGVLERNLQALKLPFIYQLLPHLMNNHNSLRPAYHMKGEKSFAEVVIGIPTVKRDKENYLMITLNYLVHGLTAEDINTTLIVVMVGETDLEYVINTARHIENKFPQQVEAGLIELISPSALYYPDFDVLPVTLGDSLKRVKWRTKQNLDTMYLMAYAQTKGTFYLMLEDDVIAKNKYMQEIKEYTAAITIANPDWFFIEYCHIGGIGKLFKSTNLIHFITYVQLFYYNMPIDWLLESYLADRVCTIDKTSRPCQRNKQEIRPKYKTSLFQHIGLYSSLKGKIQKIKDSHFGAVPTFYPHQNPPLESLRTNIQEHSDHSLRKAYIGEAFFWGRRPKNGDYIEFWFERPTILEKYMFRSGNAEHASDKFYDTTVEVLPVNKTNFTVVGSFDEFGLADNEIKHDIGPLSAIRIKVNRDSHFWVILSEIELKPAEEDR